MCDNFKNSDSAGFVTPNSSDNGFVTPSSSDSVFVTSSSSEVSDPLCKTDTEPRNERPRFDPDDRNREKVTHEHPHCSHEYLFSSTDPIYADGLHTRIVGLVRSSPDPLFVM